MTQTLVDRHLIRSLLGCASNSAILRGQTETNCSRAHAFGWRPHGPSQMRPCRALTWLAALAPGVDTRVVLTGNPNLPKSQRTFSHWFDTSVVRAPTKADFGIGNAPKDPLRGPGINNWDISLFKNFNLAREGRVRLQYRLELYNAFNHTQYATIDTTARFDLTTGAQVNAQFGSVHRNARCATHCHGVKVELLKRPASLVARVAVESRRLDVFDLRSRDRFGLRLSGFLGAASRLFYLRRHQFHAHRANSTGGYFCSGISVFGSLLMLPECGRRQTGKNRHRQDTENDCYGSN